MLPARELVERLRDRLLARSPAQLVFQHLARNKLRVLAYHGIESAESFARQIEFLVGTARPVSIDDVTRHLSGGPSLPERAVLVTFDDGQRSVLEVGLPILRAHGVPAVAFVVAGLLGTDDPYWWDETKGLVLAGAVPPPTVPRDPDRLVAFLKTVPNAKRLEVLAALRRTVGRAFRQRQLEFSDLAILEAGGIAVGNHSLTHPCLDRCDDLEIQTEIAEAHRILSDAVGHPPVAFAYPNGDWDIRVRRAVATTGYRAAFVFDHALSPVPPTDPLCISRLRVSTLTSLPRLATIVSGLHPSLLRMRRTLVAGMSSATRP